MTHYKSYHEKCKVCTKADFKKMLDALISGQYCIIEMESITLENIGALSALENNVYTPDTLANGDYWSMDFQGKYCLFIGKKTPALAKWIGYANDPQKMDYLVRIIVNQIGTRKQGILPANRNLFFRNYFMTLFDQIGIARGVFF